MTRSSKGLLLILFGGVAIIGGAVVGISGIFPMIQNFKPVAVVETGGRFEFYVSEPGTFTVWHDFRTTHNGASVINTETPPTGVTASLEHVESGRQVKISPITHSETLNSGGRECIGVGRLDIEKAGSYALTASNATGPDKYVFSLTEGSFLGSMGKFGLRLVLGAVLGLAGVVSAIIGIVLMMTKPKAIPALTQAPPAFPTR